LTEVGLAQAAAVGRRIAARRTPPSLPLPAEPPVEIIHSTLARTAATADAIASAIRDADPTLHALGPRGDRGFLEIGQGEWEGLYATDIATRYADTIAAWRRRPWETIAPGGETLPEVAARVRPALANALATMAHGRDPGTLDRSQVSGYGDAAPTHPWSVVVGHDGVFKIVLLTLFDLPLERFWMWSMDLCGISIVEFRAGRPVLRAHDLTDHLAAIEAASSSPADATRPEGAL
jgi:phosphoserine phosphatase